MHRLSCFVFIFVLQSIIHLTLSSTSTPVALIAEEESIHDSEDFSSLLTQPLPLSTPIAESIVEDIVDNVTDPIIPVTSATIIIEEQVKQFLTEYSLNVNLSSSLLSDVTFNTQLNDSILLIFEKHEIILLNKNNGTIQNYFKSASIIPTNQQSNFIVIFDDFTQELWIFNSTSQQNSIVSFKPKQIHILSSTNNSWIAETSDGEALHISQNSGRDWKKIDDSTSSTILGWSNQANSLVILQHSRYIKLLDITTYKLNSILTDVSSAKLFSRYLFAKRSNTNESIMISHVNNLADEAFRSLPKRLQSQGNFYCAIEDVNTQDLLLLFITNNRLGENDETVLPTCNLVSYSRENLFYLSNIDCGSVINDMVECSKGQIPFYQVHGLSKSVFIANVAQGPTTMVSFDGGATWNRTHFECDKMITCPNNATIVINSLTSSNDAPGIIVGKALDGSNEYIAISTNGGRLWRLSSKGNEYFTAVSNPNALIVVVPNNNQQSTNHSYRYSTDYGRTWHQGVFSNETSFQILSLISDNNNIFHVLTINNENVLKLIQLDFNLLIPEKCARHQLKEWSFHGDCVNGSKLYYKRRTAGSHCLDNNLKVRIEPCVCSLLDFECSPGYKRSKDGICLPQSHYIYSHDCICGENSTLLTKRRGYVKSSKSQCSNGIENYLSDVFVTLRDPNHPNFFLYGTDSRTQRSIVEIHTSDFDQNDEEDDDEGLVKNTIWLIDQTYEITGLVFNENGKQVYMAVQRDQLAIIYRIGKNFRQQNRQSEQLVFDPNNELYKSTDERIEYLTIDWLTQNLYVLTRNKKSLQQTIFLLDMRTQKRRTIIKSQHIQPSILIVDPIKTDLYWITHNSPLTFNIGNLQGQIKKQIRLFENDSNVSYMAYDTITHEIIFVVDSNIYGLNTLNSHLPPRVVYEHSAIIKNALYVRPILYFTNDYNETEAATIYLNAIDISARSFAKNIAKFKDFNSLKLFIDISPIRPISATTTINRCANNPCSDLCISLEHGRFRCLCNDNARYQSCSCPTDERFIAGSCQAKNGQCAPGRVLCQNQINCAESARICEQDHTQYTEAFKTTARCTLDKPNDGFDCYYSGNAIDNNTCIPFEWLCDGVYDCPLGNDEEHCQKLTTTMKPASNIGNRCLTEKKFTHVMCQNKCMKINDVCRNASNALSCLDQFHLNCKQTSEDQYACKCYDDKNHCIAMIEQCDEYEHCNRICKDSVHYANSKSNVFEKHSSIIWIVLVMVILIILFIVILFITVRYIRQRKLAKKTPVPSRTPAATAATDDHPPTDTREKLLEKATNTTKETS